MALDTDVLIVGAGPAGLVLALLLGRSGIDVTVLEQSAGFAREYRGEGVQPGTMRIFADLGLAEQMRALDHGSPQQVTLLLDGRVVHADLGRLLRGGPAASFLPQPGMLGVLADAARATGRVRIALQSPVRALCTDQSGRVSGVVASVAGTETAVRAHTTVGCDGRFSRTREAARIALDGTPAPFDVLWFALDAAAPSHTVYAFARGRRLSFAFPSRSTVVQVGWLVRKGETAMLRARPFPETKRDLVEGAPPPLRAALEERLSAFSQLSPLPIVSQCARRWTAPGLLLIGDAAHPMSPVAAQGINVAVADAVLAARKLAAAAEPATRDEAGAAFEAERRPGIRRIQRQQNAFAWALHLFGPVPTLRVGLALASAAARAPCDLPVVRGVFDRFLWGDPPVRADEAPWSTAAPAKDSSARAL